MGKIENKNNSWYQDCYQFKPGCFRGEKNKTWPTEQTAMKFGEI